MNDSNSFTLFVGKSQVKKCEVCVIDENKGKQATDGLLGSGDMHPCQ